VTRVVVLTVTGLWVVILDVEKVVGLVHVSVGLVIVHRVLTGIGEIGAICSVVRDFHLKNAMFLMARVDNVKMGTGGTSVI